MSQFLDRFRGSAPAPPRGRPYPRHERKADRRAARADAHAGFPANPDDPEPTPTMKVRIAEFWVDAAAAYHLVVAEEIRVRALIASADAAIARSQEAVEAAQQRLSAPGGSAGSGVNGQDPVTAWRARCEANKAREGLVAARDVLAGHARAKASHEAAVEAGRLAYNAERDALAAHYLRRIFEYGQVLCREHSFSQQLSRSSLTRQVGIEEWPAMARMLELEARIRNGHGLPAASDSEGE